MDFFGIGAPELVLILLIFFIFFGPAKLPEIAGMMGRAIRKLKQASAEMNRNLQEMSDEIKESGSAAGGVAPVEKGLITEIKDVSRELRDVAREVKDSADIPASLKKELSEVSRDVASVAGEAVAPEARTGAAAGNPGGEAQP